MQFIFYNITQTHIHILYRVAGPRSYTLILSKNEDNMRFVEHTGAQETMRSIAEAEEDIRNAIKSVFLEDLPISVRLFNILKSAKINSLMDVTKWKKSELRGLRNCGEGSLRELDALLHEARLDYHP